MAKKEIYRRNLPHYHLKNQTYFVTWMLADALPRKILHNLELEYNTLKSSAPKTNSNKKDTLKEHSRNYVKHFDEKLHSIKTGKYFLRIPKIAQIVADSIHFWDTKRYDLISYCIMPNHVHSVFTTFEKNEQGKSNIYRIY